MIKTAWLGDRNYVLYFQTKTSATGFLYFDSWDDLMDIHDHWSRWVSET